MPKRVQNSKNSWKFFFIDRSVKKNLYAFLKCCEQDFQVLTYLNTCKKNPTRKEDDTLKISEEKKIAKVIRTNESRR